LCETTKQDQIKLKNQEKMQNGTRRRKKGKNKERKGRMFESESEVMKRE